MATITEDYVSFEIAKLLNDKGFDEHCFCINYPLPEGGHHSIILPNLLNNSIIPFIDEYKFCRYKEDFITIPTLQMAMKWLRVNFGYNILIIADGDLGDLHYLYEIQEIDNKLLQVNGSLDIEDQRFDTYEEACEATIKYCLEHLI